MYEKCYWSIGLEVIIFRAAHRHCLLWVTEGFHYLSYLSAVADAIKRLSYQIKHGAVVFITCVLKVSALWLFSIKQQQQKSTIRMSHQNKIQLLFLLLCSSNAFLSAFMTSSYFASQLLTCSIFFAVYWQLDLFLQQPPCCAWNSVKQATDIGNCAVKWKLFKNSTTSSYNERYRDVDRQTIIHKSAQASVL